MQDALEKSPAEHILGMGDDGDVQRMMSELARSRRLGRIVRELNAAVLDGAKNDRDRAIAALSRMGLWLD